MICLPLTLFLLLAATVPFTSARCNQWPRLNKQCGCFPDWVQCDSGECIPKSRVCDGTADCKDRSDERGCTPCPPGFTHMPRVNGCYAVVRENLEWGIAGLRCKELYPDAHLLMIESSAEQTAVAALLSRYSATSLARCARYPRGHSCREMFWTAGQRYDLERGPSPFVWKQTPGTGSCCGGTCMEEMDYTYWSRGEPNNRGAYDADLNPTSPPSQEKCMQLCRGWAYRWNDALCEIPTCSICEVDLPGAVASRHGHDAREAPAHDHAHATEADDDDH